MKKHHPKVVLALLALAFLLTPAFSAAAASPPSSPYGLSPSIDRSAPYTPLIKSLLAALTVTEKLSLVAGSNDPTPPGQAGYLTGIPRLGIPALRYADSDGVNV